MRIDVELADGFEFGVEEFEAQGAGGLEGEEIEDAAAAELLPFLNRNASGMRLARLLMALVESPQVCLSKFPTCERCSA